MSDLISRQAMINTIRQRRTVFCKNRIEFMALPKDEKARVDEIDNFISDLVNAPDADPEPEEFEWCHGCKEYDKENHCCHRWTKVIRKTVEEVKSQWKWTPVTEALPEDMDRLLVTIVRSDGEKRVRSGYYYKGLFMMDNGDTWNETDKEALAWMPLPEAYGGE